MKFHRFLGALLTVALLGFSQTGRAQNDDQTFQKLDAYFSQDIFLAPGRGLKAVYLGQRFEGVLRAWGQPSSTKRVGLLRFDRRWTYNAGGSTTVIVEGGKTVELMTVLGGPTSAYLTTEGVRFGTPFHQVGVVYGPDPEGSMEDGLEYPSIGISFEFKGGVVSMITIEPPDEKKSSN